MAQPNVSAELLEALEKLASVLETEDFLKETLRSIADLSVTVLPGCDGAGVTLSSGGRVGTAAATDDYTLEVDQIQYDTDQGPCLEAFKQNEFRQIIAVSEETRWPEFCRRAAEIGFRSSISFPLKNNGVTGALNIYAKAERAFEQSDIDLGGILARQATIALQNARTYLAAHHVAEHLSMALQSREIIGQAKGILMEREDVTDEQAFEMLKTLSQNINVKVRDIAQRLIDEKSYPSS